MLPSVVPYPVAIRHHERLRQSMLAGFANCQLSAGHELRISLTKPGDGLHTSGWTTHRASAGRLIHETLQRALRHMVGRQEQRIPPEVVNDLWDAVLRQADVPLSQTFALPAHEDALARRTLRKWARDNEFTVADVYGVEIRLDATIAYPDGAGGLVDRVLTGQLDLLLVDPSGRHATVVDHKDTWKLPTRKGSEVEDLDDDEADEQPDDVLSLEGVFQQRFYALLIFLHPDFRAVQSVTLREFYVRRSRAREATIWRHELPALVAYFGSLAERFDRCYEAAVVTRRGRVRRHVMATPAQWGEPSPGAHCSYCTMFMDCPLDRDAREGGTIATPEQAEDVAGVLLRARRIVKATEASLRTWADHHGPVRVRDAKRDRFFGYVEAERTERPSRKQLDDALLAGRDPRRLYRRRVHTRFTDFSPEVDVGAGLSDDDVVAMFERASELAEQKRRPRTRA